MTAPLVVVQDGAEVPAVARRLAKAGFTVRQGFVVPTTPWDLGSLRLVLCGIVRGRDEVTAVVVAAARGAGVVVACPRQDLAILLRADLGRIGVVTSGVDGRGGQQDSLPLDDQQRALLERLAAGESINAAATAEFISLRTANRRLSQARTSLGVRTTREAVVAYLKSRDAAKS